jgi:hypothetical protein
MADQQLYQAPDIGLEARELQEDAALPLNTAIFIFIFFYYFFYYRCTQQGGTPEILERKRWFLKVICNKAVS